MGGAFQAGGRSDSICYRSLIVSPAAIVDVTTDFTAGKRFRVDVGVSRLIADGANELVKVSGFKSLRILGKDLCRSNRPGHGAL